MIRKNQPNKSIKILLNTILAYFIFAIIAAFVLCSHIALFQDYPEKWLNISVATTSIVFLLSPVNTLVVVLLYLLKINEFVLLKLKVVILESTLYSLMVISIDYMDFIPMQLLDYSFLFPYVVIIPLLSLFRRF